MDLFSINGWVSLPIWIGIITALLACIIWYDRNSTGQRPPGVSILSEKEAVQMQQVKKALGLPVRLLRRFPHGASKILDFLYLSSVEEATNRKLLRDLGITHVINCAAGDCPTGPKFYRDSVKYLEFSALDNREYYVMQHFDDVYKFIEDSRQCEGRTLIHCIMGVNRSAALAIGYVMVHKEIGPLEAVVFVRKARNGILRNEAFQRQIVQFANHREL